MYIYIYSIYIYTYSIHIYLYIFSIYIYIQYTYIYTLLAECGASPRPKKNIYVYNTSIFHGGFLQWEWGYPESSKLRPF